jgi:hypothetical protein
MQPFATLAAAHFYGAEHQAGTVGQMAAIPPDEGAGNPDLTSRAPAAATSAKR